VFNKKTTLEDDEFKKENMALKASLPFAVIGGSQVLEVLKIDFSTIQSIIPLPNFRLEEKKFVEGNILGAL